MNVRPAAVAGSFYPGEPHRLRSMVEMLLDRAPEPVDTPPGGQSLKAVIVPHAGYVYSGSTAAQGYRRLAALADQVKHVVIVGPTHRVGIRGIALPDAGAMATPLGDVPLWEEGVRIGIAQPAVQISAAVHAQEHSLEVQLPFLQVVLPQADILPLAAGWVEPAVVTTVLDAVWDQPGTVIVISSDLSHYHPYDQANAIDRATVAQIMALDATIDHDQACGATGVDALLLAARARGLTPRLEGLRNSGDTAGDKTGVVGYVAVSFCEEG